MLGQDDHGEKGVRGGWRSQQGQLRAWGHGEELGLFLFSWFSVW